MPASDMLALQQPNVSSRDGLPAELSDSLLFSPSASLSHSAAPMQRSLSCVVNSLDKLGLQLLASPDATMIRLDSFPSSSPIALSAFPLSASPAHSGSVSPPITQSPTSAAQIAAITVTPPNQPAMHQCVRCPESESRMKQMEVELRELAQLVRAHVPAAALSQLAASIVQRYDAQNGSGSSFAAALRSPMSNTIMKKQRLSVVKGETMQDGELQPSASPLTANTEEASYANGDEEAEEVTEEQTWSCAGSSVYYPATTAAAQGQLPPATALPNSRCKPCPLLTNLSKHPLRVTYVDIPREFTMSKAEAEACVAEERTRAVRVAVRIMGRRLGPNGEELPLDGRPANRSDIWVVAKDICAALHIRKGNVAKTIANFEPGLHKASLSVLCQRGATTSTHILTVLSVAGVNKLLQSSRSAMVPRVSKWIKAQIDELCGPECVSTPTTPARASEAASALGRKRKAGLTLPLNLTSPHSPAQNGGAPAPLSIPRTAPPSRRHLPQSTPSSPTSQRTIQEHYSAFPASSARRSSVPIDATAAYPPPSHSNSSHSSHSSSSGNHWLVHPSPSFLLQRPSPMSALSLRSVCSTGSSTWSSAHSSAHCTPSSTPPMSPRMPLHEALQVPSAAPAQTHQPSTQATAAYSTPHSNYQHAQQRVIHQPA